MFLFPLRIRGYCSYLYHKSIHALFHVYLYFSQPFCLLQAFSQHPQCIGHLPSGCIQVGSIPLRSFNLFLTKNNLPILGKEQFVAEPPHISFLKTINASINSLCLHSLAFIRWFLLTFFQFLVKILSQQSIFPKVVSTGYQI